MVWPIEEKKALIESLHVLKQRCATYHAAEVETRPGELLPWILTTRVGRSHPHRRIILGLPFAITDYSSPSEAANDARIASWRVPASTRFTDVGLYLAMKSIGRQERVKRHPYDFTLSQGCISTRRVPYGKPVILWAHGLPWVAVCRSSQILCGEKLASRAGWLLDIDQNALKGIVSDDAAFLAGIVLVPRDIFPLERGTFEMELMKHVNDTQGLDPLLKPKYLWKAQTHFCTDWRDLVIDLTPDGPRLRRMNRVAFFKRPCANLTKYPKMKHRTAYAPEHLFVNRDIVAMDYWCDEFYKYSRTPSTAQTSNHDDELENTSVTAIEQTINYDNDLPNTAPSQTDPISNIMAELERSEADFDLPSPATWTHRRTTRPRGLTVKSPQLLQTLASPNPTNRPTFKSPQLRRIRTNASPNPTNFQFPGTAKSPSIGTITTTIPSSVPDRESSVLELASCTSSAPKPDVLHSSH